MFYQYNLHSLCIVKIHANPAQQQWYKQHVQEQYRVMTAITQSSKTNPIWLFDMYLNQQTR